MAGDVVLITGNVLSSGLSVLINVIPGEQQILDLSSRGVELDPLTVVDLKLAAEFILRGFLFFFGPLSSSHGTRHLPVCLPTERAAPRQYQSP